MADNVSNDASLQSKLKEWMKEWRHIVLVLHSLLIWEKSYYSALIALTVTALFCLIWYLESSVLTTISVLAIVSTIADYSVPLVVRQLSDANHWSASKQSTYERICSELSICWHTIVISYDEWQTLKHDKPKIYYASLLSVLLLFTWISNIINNLFLTYLAVLSIALFPGLKHNGVLDLMLQKIIHFRSGDKADTHQSKKKKK